MAARNLEISFIGKITACKHLVIDGLVEAFVVGKTRFFKGKARTGTVVCGKGDFLLLGPPGKRDPGLELPEASECRLK